MSTEIACDALRSQRRLELRYDGFVRIVEVHAVGVTKDGRSIMRVWQVDGGSSGNERTGWKLLRIDEASGMKLTEQRVEGPRDGYKRGDRAMSRIICEL
jgi:hypothetical protein